VSSWLNRTVAVPVVGFAFDPLLRAPAFLWQDLEPLTSVWARDGLLRVLEPEPMKIRIERNSIGTLYDVDQQNIVVSFNYPVTFTEDGHQPALVKVGQRQPFTELLAKVMPAADEIATALLKKPRNLQRIGFVANVRIPPDSLPPGVELFLKHLGRPWGGMPTAAVTRISAKLGGRDQCHHQVQWQADSDVMILALDWQRYFDPAREVDAKGLAKLAAEASVAALTYFEKFGEGDLDYAAE